MTPKIYAISIRQPWAWAILNAGKDIENRNWKTYFRGRILVHAGTTFDATGRDWLKSIGIELPEYFQVGGIVGSIEIVDCVENSESRWFFGRYGFVLKNPKSINTVRMPGKLGIFEVKSGARLLDRHDDNIELGGVYQACTCRYV